MFGDCFLEFCTSSCIPNASSPIATIPKTHIPSDTTPTTRERTTEDIFATIWFVVCMGLLAKVVAIALVRLYEPYDIAPAKKAPIVHFNGVIVSLTGVSGSLTIFSSLICHLALLWLYNHRYMDM